MKESKSEYVSVDDIEDNLLLINKTIYVVEEISDCFIKAKPQDPKNGTFVREFSRPHHERPKEDAI